MIKTFGLIIGAMKCGTTSLFHYLAEHPQVSPSSDKEPFFFCDDRRFQRGTVVGTKIFGSGSLGTASLWRPRRVTLCIPGT